MPRMRGENHGEAKGVGSADKSRRRSAGLDAAGTAASGDADCRNASSGNHQLPKLPEAAQRSS